CATYYSNFWFAYW
nr:immunoglobulin heavy chain junction region [Mus musculus]